MTTPKLTPKQDEGARLLQKGPCPKGGPLALATARSLQAFGLCTVTGGKDWVASATGACMAYQPPTPTTEAASLPSEPTDAPLVPPAAPDTLLRPPAALSLWGALYKAAAGRWLARLASAPSITLAEFAEDVAAETTARLGADVAALPQTTGTLVKIADVLIASGWLTPMGTRGEAWDEVRRVDFGGSAAVAAPPASEAPPPVAKKARKPRAKVPEGSGERVAGSPELPAAVAPRQPPAESWPTPPETPPVPDESGPEDPSELTPTPRPEVYRGEDYAEFLKSKAWVTPAAGFECGEADVNAGLFPYQRDIVRWALRRGRAGIFAATGLGKSRIAIDIAKLAAEHTGKPSLILTPLAVAPQFVREGAQMGVVVQHVRSQAEVTERVVVCNYEKLHKLTPAAFGCVILDEASILKSFNGKTKQLLVSAFRATPYRFTATATPSPNDHEELGNQCEFLGVMTRTEMLASFFCHDGGNTSSWRLKGHAKQEFWRWMSGWSVLLRLPSDLGYEDGAHVLPPLRLHHHIVESDDTQAREAGLLFAIEARTLGEQRVARKGSLAARVEKAAAIVSAEPNVPWLLWGDMNDECDALEKAIPGTVQIAGADEDEEKEARMMAFVRGETRVLTTKPSIFGFGLNLQHCSRMVFVGLSHSFERMFQAIRRCWRFGQKNPVDVHIVLSEAERSVLRNIQRKEAEAEKMAIGMALAMGELQRANVRGIVRETESYHPAVAMVVPAWIHSETSEAAE